jgi:hypothetical protein
MRVKAEKRLSSEDRGEQEELGEAGDEGKGIRREVRKKDVDYGLDFASSAGSDQPLGARHLN